MTVKTIPISETPKEVADWRREVVGDLDKLSTRISAIIIPSSGATTEEGQTINLTNYYNKTEIDKLLDELAIAGYSSPLDTKGDILTFDTDETVLPVGTDGQVLTADSSASEGVSWQTPSSGGKDIKIDSGYLGHGSYATVNGNTSTGTTIEYYTGYTTTFFMASWDFDRWGPINNPLDYIMDIDIGINRANGLITATQTSVEGGTQTTTGNVAWVAISVEN